MRSRFLAVLAAFAFAVAPMAAQTPVTFTLVGGAWSPQPLVTFNGNTYYSSPYLGSFTGGTDPFWVWCVDYSHSVGFGDTYTAELTPLLGNLSPYTRYGTAGLNGYEWAAYLAGQMTPGNPARAVQLQLAMWDAVSSGAFAGETSGLAAALSSLGLSSTFYAGASPLLDPENWALIDGTGNFTGKQEFLVRIEGVGTTTEVVPEPVTMSLLATGLAGMALANRKRRRNTAA